MSDSSKIVITSNVILTDANVSGARRRGKWIRQSVHDYIILRKTQFPLTGFLQNSDGRSIL